MKDDGTLQWDVNGVLAEIHGRVFLSTRRIKKVLEHGKI